MSYPPRASIVAALVLCAGCSGVSAEAINTITYSIHAGSSFVSLHDDFRFAADGTVRFRTISPASYSEASPVGEFVATGETALFQRLRTALAPSLRVDDGAPWSAAHEATIEVFSAEQASGRPLILRRTDGRKNALFDQWDSDFTRVRKAAFAQPVNAIRLGCTRSAATIRCRLEAIGTEASRVPAPAGTASYDFWCFDRERHMTRAASVGAPVPGPPTTMELKPGEGYDIALPAGTSCDGSLMLSIRSPSPESVLFNTVAVSSGAIVEK